MADENKNIEQPVDDMDAMVADLKKLKIESEVTNEDAKRLKEKQLSASKRAGRAYLLF